MEASRSKGQISPLNRLVAELFRTSLVHDLPLFHYQTALSNVKGEIEVLLDQQQRRTNLIDDFGKQFSQAGHDAGLYALRWLVEQEHFGLAAQCPGNCEHLLLSTGQRAAFLPQPLTQYWKVGEDLLGDPNPSFALSPGTNQKIFFYTQFVDDSAALRHITNAQTSNGVGRQP